MNESLKRLMSTLIDDIDEITDVDDLNAFVDKTIIAIDAFKTAVNEKYTDDEIVEFVNESVMNKHIENLEIDFD